MESMSMMRIARRLRCTPHGFTTEALTGDTPSVSVATRVPRPEISNAMGGLDTP
jgi:hypothetical protein